MRLVALLRAAYHRRSIRLYLEHRRFLEREIRGTDYAIAAHDRALRDMGQLQ